MSDKNKTLQERYGDEIKGLLANAHRLGVSYADVRVQEDRGTKIAVKDSTLEEVVSGNNFGLGIRVLYKGSWGLASTNDYSKLKVMLDRALRAAKSGICKGKRKVKLAEVKPSVDKVIAKPKIRFEDVSIERKVKMLKEVYSSTKVISDRIKSIRLGYVDINGRELYMTSEGTNLYQEQVFTGFLCVTTAYEGGLIQQCAEGVERQSGFELYDEKNPVEVARKSANRAVALLSAKAPPGGKFTTVIHPTLAGVLIHEAVGHAAEADIVQSGDSVFAGKIGKKIAPDYISIIDDATMFGHGHYKYDDEGVPAKKNYIIKRGILNTYLHTRETACRAKVQPTGNARVQSYEYMPIVRMSNTYLEASDWKLDEMLKEVKNGIYLEYSKGGEVNSGEGTFTFSSEQGYVIENGEKKELLRDCTLSGNIFEILNNIDAVGNDLEMQNIGECVKGGQTVLVGYGSPHVRISRITIGGSG
ncbi:MAG: TldD/PmbA family protein [Thermoplasmata archaeon]